MRVSNALRDAVNKSVDLATDFTKTSFEPGPLGIAFLRQTSPLFMVGLPLIDMPPVISDYHR